MAGRKSSRRVRRAREHRWLSDVRLAVRGPIRDRPRAGSRRVSVVYAAHDRQVGQDVALKLLVPSPSAANQMRERMRREVNAVRRLAHPNIVAVFDFVEDGPYGAVIMELVDGEDLDARVRRVVRCRLTTSPASAARSRPRCRSAQARDSAP